MLGIGLGVGLTAGRTPAAASGASPNLLRWTEEFDNAVWVASGVTVTASATTPPPEASRADRLDFSADSVFVQSSQIAAAAGAGVAIAPDITTAWQRCVRDGTFDGQTYTFSIFLKGLVGGEGLSIAIARVGGVLQCQLVENASIGCSVYVSGAKLELGVLTDYVHRTT